MTMSKQRTSHRVKALVLAVTLGWWAGHLPSLAGQTLDDKVQELARQVTQLNAVILELRSEVSAYREETRELRQQLRSEPQASPLSAASPAVLAQQTAIVASVADLPPDERLTALEENQRLLSDRMEEQYQTKVESSSRYRMKLSGIVLLNAFANQGRVDSQEDPDLALRRGPLDTDRTFGISALQSQVGIETYGPVFAGAKTSAGLQFDFFGISPSSAYAASWGAVRLRTASIRLDWARTSVVIGQDAPFISPLSPTSIASLAYPAFSYSGNLWNWIPQARIEHRLNVSEQSTIAFQGGVLDPVPRGPSQPAYASRIAWSYGSGERPLTLGVGGFYSRENRGAGRTQDGWATTADWFIPLGSRVELSGELYRGRAIGSLGAAQSRSVVFSGLESDPASSMIGVNSAGGWAQLAIKVSPTVEFHAAHGEDRPYRRDLFRFSQSPTISRNRTEMFNVIYRPRTDLLFSLEYRRFKTWRIDTSENAGHLNLGVGVLF
jgi:outer membrane murein-binding lipoprotein Lpp